MSDPIEYIGSPLRCGADGVISESKIATVFPRERLLVNTRGPHDMQRFECLERLVAKRAAQGLPPLGEDEQGQVWASSVDLIVKDGFILIRPNAADMPLAFAADALLQEHFPKRRIRFIHGGDRQIQQALRARGENWRMAARPRTSDEIERLVRTAKIAIGGRAIYYYSVVSGTRYLTLGELEGLAALDDEGLRLHMAELEAHFERFNRKGCREVTFYGAGARPRQEFRDLLRGAGAATDVRERHRALVDLLRETLPPELRTDALHDPEWRQRMFRQLVIDEETEAEEVLKGIASEFFLQIDWLPGGRIEEGTLVFDELFEETDGPSASEAPSPRIDARVTAFISNYLREFGDLEYVNIGGLSTEIGRRDPTGGHRAYMAEVKHRGAEVPVRRVIRMQKWGIEEHLDESKDLLRSIMEAEDYIEYTLDRRLGCRQLGMRVPDRLLARRVWETYRGPRLEYRDTRIWSAYYERDYIEGIASDKIPPARLQDDRFALMLARLLGQAAAPNLVVGRAALDGGVIFDDGDEVVGLGPQGMPERLVAADHVGTFRDYTTPLAAIAPAYALPVLRRRAFLKCADRFEEAYLAALFERLSQIQAEYRRRRRAFDGLFRYARKGKEAFSDRWRQVLDRLNATDAEEVRRRIEEALRA